MNIQSNILYERFMAFMQKNRTGGNKYKTALAFFGFTSFDYNIETKKIESSNINEALHLPKGAKICMDDIINAGIIAERSEENLKNVCERVASGCPKVESVICINDSNGEERIIELQLITIFDKTGKPVRATGISRDITEIHMLQREKQYGIAFHSNQQFIYEANISHDRLIKVDKKWADALGVKNICSFTGLRDISGIKVIPPEYQKLFFEKLSAESIICAFEKGERIIHLDYQKRVSNDYRWFRKNVIIIKDELLGDIIIRCYVSEIHDMKLKELRQLEDQKIYNVLRSEADIIYEVNITQDICFSGDEKWKEIFGISQTIKYSEIIETINKTVLYSEDRAGYSEAFLRENVISAYKRGEKLITFDCRRLDQTDQFAWMRCNFHLYEDPKTGDLMGHSYIKNINKEKKRELKLIYKSEHDALTEFYNKETIERLITDFLSTSDGNTCHAFFIIDIDHFKLINDNFGHAFGDVILSQISNKIKSAFTDNDIIGRIGGDEFIVLMKNIDSKFMAMAKAEELCEKIRDTFTKDKVMHSVSLSMGLAFYNEHGKTYDDLYKKSDIALYSAKKNGRNRFAAYNEHMGDSHININTIKEREYMETSSMEGNISEYVFRILYETLDKKSAIASVLELVGKYYDVSRTYIFENSYDGRFVSNTFGWCSKDIAPQISNLQNLSYEELENYKDNFNSDGIFFMPDINEMDSVTRKILEPQGVKAMLQFSIVINGNFKGFIGFDECNPLGFNATNKMVADLKNIANILGVFIMEMRTFEANNATKEMALSIINGLDSYAYVCNPENHKILFVNDKTLEIISDLKIGDLCYESIWNRTEPCEICPMKKLIKDSLTRFSMDMLNSNLGIWIKATASWISWMDGKKMCLVDSVDITEYKIK